ncbi:ABC transporter permease [Bulleidia sp. zg-1006]|uniref:ABC transporter permease n=1 Tax=Bulleidia sp. zg-1006 TaxID=2806552 RepID=UPI00193980CE|nr:ABC transporter permease [Bulleidia sp. zg-1006]QRG86704.1 ABC transporter permease [Bulleidia sp. zg-1006]
MFWLVKKEYLYDFRYKMRSLNLIFNPFFMMAPYVLLAQNYGAATRVLGSMLLWSWLVQLIYGISYGIESLKIEGVLGMILMSPMHFITYQFFYYIYLVLRQLLVTGITLVLTWLFLGITVDNIVKFLITLIIGSVGLFCFTVGYSSFVLKFKKMQGINTTLQNVFGFLSGYTIPITKFPIALRFVSYLIPLTYAIHVMDIEYMASPILIGLFVLVSLVWLIIGILFVNKNLNGMKMRGDFEQW